MPRNVIFFCHIAMLQSIRPKEENMRPTPKPKPSSGFQDILFSSKYLIFNFAGRLGEEEKESSSDCRLNTLHKYSNMGSYNTAFNTALVYSGLWTKIQSKSFALLLTSPRHNRKSIMNLFSFSELQYRNLGSYYCLSERQNPII